MVISPFLSSATAVNSFVKKKYHLLLCPSSKVKQMPVTYSYASDGGNLRNATGSFQVWALHEATYTSLGAVQLCSRTRSPPSPLSGRICTLVRGQQNQTRARGKYRRAGCWRGALEGQCYPTVQQPCVCTNTPCLRCARCCRYSVLSMQMQKCLLIILPSKQRCRLRRRQIPHAKKKGKYCRRT